MTQWDDRMRDHPVVTLPGLVDEALGRLPKVESEHALEVFGRTARVASGVRALLGSADPLLVSANMLESLASLMQPIPSQVDEFGRDGLESTLDELDGRLEAILNLVGWPLNYVGLDPETLREAGAGYRDASGKLLQSLAEDVGSIKDQLPALTASTEQAVATITQAATDATAAIEAGVAEQSARLATLTTDIETQRTTTSGLIADYNTQFLAGETERTRKADRALADELTKLETVRTEGEKAVADLAQQLGSDAAQSMADIQGFRTDAEALVDTIGAIGYSGSYGAYAKQQKAPADAWRRIAAGSIIALLVVEAWIVYAYGVALTIESVAQRALITIPFLLLFGFAVQQSGTHRAAENSARQRELELSAMDPYLVRLPQATREDIKADAARRMFGKDLASVDGKGGDDVVGTSQLLGLIQELIKKIGK